MDLILERKQINIAIFLYLKVNLEVSMLRRLLLVIGLLETYSSKIRSLSLIMLILETMITLHKLDLERKLLMANKLFKIFMMWQVQITINIANIRQTILLFLQDTLAKFLFQRLLIWEIKAIQILLAQLKKPKLNVFQTQLLFQTLILSQLLQPSSIFPTLVGSSMQV